MVLRIVKSSLQLSRDRRSFALVVMSEGGKKIELQFQIAALAPLMAALASLSGKILADATRKPRTIDPKKLN